MIRTLRTLLPIITFVTLLGMLYGCATSGLPSAKNYELIKSGKRAIVLLRFTCEIDGKPHEVFSRGPLLADNMYLALGDFETGGRPIQIEQTEPIFPSPEARKDGWMYLLLKPGLHYLAVRPFGSRHFESAPLWRFDVPFEAGLVYVGTLHMPSVRENHLFIPTGFSPFWDRVVVRSEEGAARKMADMFFPELGTIKTVLMQPHAGPLIIRKPPGQ
jgi:hypothetical protein